jgi:hypothetical protein
MTDSPRARPFRLASEAVGVPPGVRRRPAADPRCMAMCRLEPAMLKRPKTAHGTVKRTRMKRLKPP